MWVAPGLGAFSSLFKEFYIRPFGECLSLYPGGLSDAVNALTWSLDKRPIQGADFKLNPVPCNEVLLSEESPLSDYISSPH